MSTAEINKIKLNLISWINQLSDDYVITFLDGLKHSKSKGDWWDELNEKQKKIILAGLKDAEKGDTLSSKDFWKNLKNA
jgi:hypothetical protein